MNNYQKLEIIGNIIQNMRRFFQFLFSGYFFGDKEKIVRATFE